MAASGEQQKEEGHAAVAAKRRMAQPTKKARNVATGDKEPEFLGDPVPTDEAHAKWPQRYQRGSPMRCSLIVALLATSPLRSAQFRGRSLLCVRQRLSQKCRCRWTELCFLAGNLSNLGVTLDCRKHDKSMDGLLHIYDARSTILFIIKHDKSMDGLLQIHVVDAGSRWPSLVLATHGHEGRRSHQEQLRWVDEDATAAPHGAPLSSLFFLAGFIGLPPVHPGSAGGGGPRAAAAKGAVDGGGLGCRRRWTRMVHCEPLMMGAPGMSSLVERCIQARPPLHHHAPAGPGVVLAWR